MKIILASSSPRRRQILSPLVSDLVIITPDIDEIPMPGEKPSDFALRAATEKAMAVNGMVKGGYRLIIAADTIVTIDDIILGKPVDYNDAFCTLTRLSGREHSVITALCLVGNGGMKTADFLETRVRFRELSSEDIRMYLERIEYRDKAGSYAFQEGGSYIIESLEGSVTNVIGFPLSLFYSMAVGMDMTGDLFLPQVPAL